MKNNNPKRLVILTLWSLLGLVAPQLVRGQIPSELPCAAGSTDLISPTYDSNTQATRSWVCVSALGFVTSPVFASAGGATAFNAITSGTNTTAAMILGTGSSLATSGTATITQVNAAIQPGITQNGASTIFTLTPNVASGNIFDLTVPLGKSLALGVPGGGTGPTAISATDFTGDVMALQSGLLELVDSSGDGILAGIVAGTTKLTGNNGATILTLNTGATFNVPLNVPSCVGCSLVTSVFSRTGAVVANAADYASTGITDATGNTLQFNGGTAGLFLLSSTTSGLTVDQIAGSTILSGNSNLTTLTLSAGSAAFNTAVSTPTPATASNNTTAATTGYVVLKLASPTAIGSTAPNTGAFTTLKGSTYSSTTNCGAVGTAANPSAVACAAAPAGAFSCATNASGGTCVVSTTAVTTNSQIFVQQTTSESTRLSVTCNATILALTAPLVSAKSNGASFTVTLPTFTVNPVCFDYYIVN